MALFYVLSEISMAFSRPEDLATLVSLHVVPHSIIYPHPPAKSVSVWVWGYFFLPQGGERACTYTHVSYMYVRPAYPSSFPLIQSRLNTGILDLDIHVINAMFYQEPKWTYGTRSPITFLRLQRHVEFFF